MSNYLSANDRQTNITSRLSTAVGGGAERPSAKLDQLIKDVGVRWKELLADDANTLETALSLMDTSSIGKARYQGNFEQLQAELRQTLKSHVDLNYQGFNSAIGSYRIVVQSVEDSQFNVNSAKESLSKARVDLATRRPVLKELRLASLKYKQMIQILDQVEELKAVPDLLESQIAQKHFLSAHATLTRVTNMNDREELSQIAALQPIHAYIANQEGVLFNILLEELSNHLYLKSPYTDSLWNVYSSGRDQISNLEQVVEDKIRFDLFKESAINHGGSSLFHDFLANFDPVQPMEEDSKKNAEVDSYYYIRLLVETLGKMNRLGSAFALIHRRLATELHRIIEKTIEEVRQRSPKGFTDIQSSGPLNIFRDFEEANDQARLSILQDFIWTLYSKLIAVLQAHRVVFEVVRAIFERAVSEGKSAEAELVDYDIFAIYRVMEGVIQALIYSYFSDMDKRITKSASSDLQSLTRAETNGSISSLRQKKKPLFRFDQVDYTRTEYQQQYESLQSTLEQAVPGLATNPSKGPAKGKLMPYTTLSLSSSHELLIRPVIFNIRVMLEPTVVFLQRTKTILPPSEKPGNKPNENFLDDFMANLFLPELEAALRHSYEEIMQNHGAFVPDPQWMKESKKPILRASNEFLRLTHTACHLLSTGYMFREKYAAVIIGTIKWLVQTCQERYTEWVESPEETPNSVYGEKNMKQGAVLAGHDKTLHHITEVLMNSQVPEERAAALAEEVNFYIARRHSQKSVNGGVKATDLLDIDSYYNLSLVVTSLRWLVLKLQKIRKVKEPEAAETTKNENNSLQARIRKRWTLLEATRARGFTDITDTRAMLGSEACNLILTGKSLEDFDEAVQSLEDLAKVCMNTLRADVRLRTIYYMDQTFTQGDYYLDSNNEERDPSIGALDTAILKCDDNMAETLTQADKDFVFSGLSSLMNELLVKEGDGLDSINNNGVTKMRYNIIALEQMLKSIVTDPNQVDFMRARSFYDKLDLNPNMLMELVKTKPPGLDSDDFKILNKLIYSGLIRQNEDSGRKDAAITAKYQCLDAQRKIHDIFWGSS